MLRQSVCVLLLLAVFLTADSQEVPEWNTEIACIIYSHCSTCHNDEGVAPFSLETYSQVYDRRGQVLQKILSGEMPPWPAKYPENAFVGDHSLSDDEVSAIETWVMNGAPEGDTNGFTLNPPEHTMTERYADAELVLDLPEFTVPPLSDNDLYKCFVFPIELEEDVFVKAVEVIPGNSKAVHHVLLYQDASDRPIQLDEADPAIGYTCFGGIGSNNAQLVGGWAPGGDPQVFPENMGIRIPAKTNLVVQVHYPEYAIGEVDQTRINLKLTTENQRELFVIPVLNHFTSMLNGPLAIPANEVKEFYQLWTVPNPKLTLIGIAPHAHLICTEMEAWAERPNGERIDLVHTPHWDFDWQKFYAYKRPIILEGGMQVYGRAVYDNTSFNHHNPNNPPRLVTLGEDTDEEMMLFFLTMTAYQQGDEHLVFDSSDHFEHHEQCGSLLSSIESLSNDLSVNIYPNPASDFINIESDQNILGIDIFHISGNRMKVQWTGGKTGRVPVYSFERGIYTLRIHSDSSVYLQKLIIE